MDGPSLGTVGIIGKTRLTPIERARLTTLGRYIALAGKTLIAVEAEGTVAAVKMGMEEGQGQLLLIAQDTITASAHVFVYADERLLSRLREAYPTLDTNTRVTVMRTPRELQAWLDAAGIVLAEKGLHLGPKSPR